ncbi:MAG: TonB family protein [bacterium]|nr:TonB family protein [bacterium]
MTISAKSFLLPSVAAHVLTAALLTVVLWSAPTFKVAKQQMIRVNLTQAAARPMRVTSSTAAPAAAPTAVPAPAQAAPPKPAPPKPAPPKPAPPKPTPPPPPKPPTIQPITPPKRTVMPVPKKVVERQKKWEAEKIRKQLAKAAETNAPPKIVKRPPPKKIEIADTTPRVNTAFEEARKRFEQLENKSDAPTTPAQPAAAPTAAVGPRTVLGGQAGVAGPQDVAGTESAVIDNFFCNGIRTAIDRIWRQPPRILGTCEVTFRLSRDGRVSDVRVSKAGPSELNKSALDAVQNASFPAFPGTL